MAPILYYVAGSAPCRTVLLAAKALNVDLELHRLDLFYSEDVQTEFFKPESNAMPTLIDDDLILTEANAIIMYLANQYARETTLYPEDPKAKAKVDQILYFTVGTVSSRFCDYFYPQILDGLPADVEKRANAEETLLLLDILLEDHEYIAGDRLSLADLSMITVVSDMEASDLNFLKYNNIRRWYELVKKTAPGYDAINVRGLKLFKSYVKLKILDNNIKRFA